MRTRLQAVLGFTLLASTIAGCAATRPATTDTPIWNADQAPALTSRSTSKHTYSVSGARLGADGIAAPGRNEFEFSHPRVDDFVEQFQTNLRGFFSGALSRSGRYVPQMSTILEKEGLPPELAYLPLIESGFREHAVSRAGAVGPWQFIPGTGRRYGLRIDRYVDERRDPVKSTHAAARYLRDLHDMFGDWHLSLAAYNSGEGRISRMLERGAGDFWEMSDRGYLHQETEDYVPEFLAALHIAETPEAYGFVAPERAASVRYDLVKVNRSLQLSTVAQLSGTSPGQIKELNPALHRGMVPPQGYAVRLPKGTKETFKVALASYKEPPPPVARHRAVKARGKSMSHGSRSAVHRGNGPVHGGKNAVHSTRSAVQRQAARRPGRTVVAVR